MGHCNPPLLLNHLLHWMHCMEPVWSCTGLDLSVRHLCWLLFSYLAKVLPHSRNWKASGGYIWQSWFLSFNLTASVKCLFHSKKMFVTMNILFEWKRCLILGPRIWSNCSSLFSLVGHGGLGMRLMKPKHELQGVKGLQYLRSHLLRCIILLYFCCIIL